MKIIVAGGGAAGFFAAITCKKENPATDVSIIEQSGHLLSKVALSGGGRCNLSNAVEDIRALVRNYPRGNKELIGAFHRFGPGDTVNWFQSNGVALKTEDGNRIFPLSNSSQTIVDCLLNQAKNTGINIHTNRGLQSVSTGHNEHKFELTLTDGSIESCDRLLLSTGGAPHGAGITAAVSLGHTIIEQIPSLFTFVVPDKRINSIPGISLPDVNISIPKTRFSERGAILITHNGLSGPAILRLSSYAARDLFTKQYHFDSIVNWYPCSSIDETRTRLSSMRKNSARKQIHSEPLFALPRRLWNSLVDASGCTNSQYWADFSRKQADNLASQIHCCLLTVTSKDSNKDEFVTCGGVKLSEVNFKKMESRIRPGLFFAGEILDIDGLTGGFNLQAAWTTGYIAGKGMVIPV